MVESLLEDIFKNVVNAEEANIESDQNDIEHDIDENGDQDQSLYVQMRNERVAEIQAEFRKKFPNFDEEIRSLKVVKKKTGGKRKKTASMTAAAPIRRSSRSIALPRMDFADRGAEAATHVSCPGVMLDEHQEEVDHGGDQGVPVDETARDEAVCGGGEVVAGGEAEYGVYGEFAGGEAAADVDALGKYGCITCNKGFRDITNLRRHVSLVHEQRSSPVVCPRTWCSAEFTVLAEMIRHKKTCLLLCPYSGCQKVFKYENVLAAHKRGHLVMERRMKD